MRVWVIRMPVMPMWPPSLILCSKRKIDESVYSVNNYKHSKLHSKYIFINKQLAAKISEKWGGTFMLPPIIVIGTK